MEGTEGLFIGKEMNSISVKDLKERLERFSDDLQIEITDPASLMVELRDGIWITVMSF